MLCVSPTIYSPPYKSKSLPYPPPSPPTFSPPHKPLFLYDFVSQSQHGQTTPCVICCYTVRKGSFSVPVTPGRHGLFWVSSCRGDESERVGVDGASDVEEEVDDDFVSDNHEFIDVQATQAPHGSSHLPDKWDVLGLGQAMVDFSGVVDEMFLKKLGLEKGTRKLVNHEEWSRILQVMDGCSYKAAAGGSLSNSLVALARLGNRPVGGRVLNVAMAGSVGSDPLGCFYRSKLQRANVHFVSPPIKDGTTGTVIVLTTPDAQRTMVAYQGTSSTVNYSSCLARMISNSSVLVVEGYLFEFPDTIKTIIKACEEAHRNGTVVAVTASDVTCIERHYDDFWEIAGNYVDIVFTNSDEAKALCNFAATESPSAAARYLSHFVPLVSVTDGARGSYLGVKGEAVYVPPSPCVAVDTCGAGDAYACGILYAILRGMSELKGIGTLAARVAAIVVGQQGTRLSVKDAVSLAESFTFLHDTSHIPSDIGSDIGSDHISSF